MAANIELIADSLDQNSPSLRDVVTPDEPAKDRVLRVSLLSQSARLGKQISRTVRKIFKK